MRKDRRKVRFEQSENAKVCMEKIIEAAKRGYENRYGFPSGKSATLAQIENSSAGIDGRAKFWSAQEAPSSCSRDPDVEDVENDTELVRIRLADCVIRVSDLNLLTPHSAVNVATASGLQLISTAPVSGWEVIKITVDSGACDTALPSSMVSSIKTGEHRGVEELQGVRRREQARNRE